MDVAERGDDHEAAIKSAVKESRASLWTAMPGIVVSYDPDKQTAAVQPAIQGYPPTTRGVAAPVNMPVCLDCPVSFPRGGGYALTFPLNEGDEGMLVFASRCIDAWWQSGGVQPQAELRMHDLSDGMFIPGVTSQPNRLASVTQTGAEIRSDDGQTRMQVASTAVVSRFQGNDDKYVEFSPGGVASGGNLSAKNAFSGGWTTPTGDVMMVLNGVLSVGNGILNPAFINSIADRIQAATSCGSLQRIVDEEIGAIYAANADLLEKLAILQAMVELLKHPEDVLAWVIKYIDLVLTPYLAPIAKIIALISATTEAVTHLVTVVEQTEERFKNCTITIPTPAELS